jgi:hypothetical protein
VGHWWWVCHHLLLVLLLFVVDSVVCSVIVHCWFCHHLSLVLLLFIVGSIIVRHRFHHCSSLVPSSFIIVRRLSVRPSYHPPCEQRLAAVGKGGVGSVQCAVWGGSVISLKNE